MGTVSRGGQTETGAKSCRRAVREQTQTQTHARPAALLTAHGTAEGDARGRPARPALRRESPKGKKGGEERRAAVCLLLWAVEGLEVEETQDAEYVRAR